MTELKTAELEAAFELVMGQARQDAAFAGRLRAAVQDLPSASVTPLHGAGAPAEGEAVARPSAVFDPYEPNLEVLLMQKQDAAVRQQLLAMSFAQLAKIVKAQRVSNVRALFGGVNGEPASKEQIADAIIASIRARIKSRFSAAS